MKFYVETKSYVKIHSETKEVREISLSNQEVREVYSETKCCLDWKEKYKNVPESPPTVYAACSSNVSAEGIWLLGWLCVPTHIFMESSSIYKWMEKFHILELTHQETDLSPLRPARSTVILCHWLGFSDVKHSFNLKYRTPAVGLMLCMQTES
jgi:hypothetical protein